MKIAIVMATLPNPKRADDGGVTYVIHQLANELVRHGQDITVFALDPRPPDALYRHSFINGPAWLGKNRLARLYLLALYIARIDFSAFDVIHTNGEDWLLGRHTPPRVRTYWGSARGEARAATSWRRRVTQAVVQYPLEFASAATAQQTVGISRMTVRHLPFIQQIIPPGVDLEHFQPRGPKAERPTILYVADRMAGRKRGYALLRAFRERVLPVCPDAELWLRCTERIDGRSIRWIPRTETTDQLAELFRQAWVFCLPSSYEGFGVPYVEALASGTAVIATHNGGADEVLDGGRFGRLVRIRDLGDNLVDLLCDDKERDRLGRLGLERAREFSWDRVADRYVDVYRAAMRRTA